MEDGWERVCARCCVGCGSIADVRLLRMPVRLRDIFSSFSVPVLTDGAAGTADVSLWGGGAGPWPEGWCGATNGVVSVAAGKH